MGSCVSCVCSEDHSSRAIWILLFRPLDLCSGGAPLQLPCLPDTSSLPPPQRQFYLISGRGETGLKIHLLSLAPRIYVLNLQQAVEDDPRVKVREGYSQGTTTLAIWDITLPHWFLEPSTW